MYLNSHFNLCSRLLQLVLLIIFWVRRVLVSRLVPSKSWSVPRFQLKLTVRVPLILTTLTWPHVSSTISSWTRMFVLSLVCAQQRNCLKSETGLVMNAMTSWKELLITWERSVDILKLLKHDERHLSNFFVGGNHCWGCCIPSRRLFLWSTRSLRRLSSQHCSFWPNCYACSCRNSCWREWSSVPRSRWSLLIYVIYNISKEINLFHC